MTVAKVRMLLSAIEKIREASGELIYQERCGAVTENVCICGARSWAGVKTASQSHNAGCVSVALTAKADLMERELAALLQGVPA